MKLKKPDSDTFKTHRCLHVVKDCRRYPSKNDNRVEKKHAHLHNSTASVSGPCDHGSLKHSQFECATSLAHCHGGPQKGENKLLDHSLIQLNFATSTLSAWSRGTEQAASPNLVQRALDLAQKPAQICMLENFSWGSLYLGSLGMCLALTSVPILRNI